MHTNLILDHPKIKDLHKVDVQTYATETLTAPGPQKIVSRWVSKLKEPFIGITVDGTRSEGLYSLEDESAPTEQMVSTKQIFGKGAKKPEVASIYIGQPCQSHSSVVRPE